MNRRMTLLSVAVLAIIAASCSAGFSKPRAGSLAEVNGEIWAFIDTDPHPNTKTTIAQIQFTSDGESWQPVTRESGRVGVVPGFNVDQECDAASGSCYRVVASNGGIRLDRSADSGTTWAEIWSISSGRLDFQNRCCGKRLFAIHDLEYIPQTGLVAVSLGEYGLLTVGLDEEIRLDTLGRHIRPESEVMVGLYIEPVFVATLALIIGWIITEQSLYRLRVELESRLGSADHVWITSRARQVPIMLPLVFFMGLGGAFAVAARAFQSVARDSPETAGWFTLMLAVVVIIAASAARHWLHRRRWWADDETQARAPFAAAATKAVHAERMGTLSAVLTFVVAVIPLILWSAGAIDEFGNAVQIGLGASAVVAAGFWIREATLPPLPE